jgi:hypothetical protein
MDERTEPDAGTEAAEQAEADYAHRADREPTAEEVSAAEKHHSATDEKDRREVAEHEEEMMEIGARVKGEGAID